MKTHSLVSLALASAVAIAAATPARAQTLEAFAQFAADTFAPGPTSGQFITLANGVVPPFPDAQPVQGISSVLAARNGDFLPFLIHTDRTGKVLEAPYPLPGVQSPQNPFLGTATPNLPRSKGFEGMAIAPDGRTLYPMLEGSLTTDTDQRRLIIGQFDVKKRRYTDKQWFYRLEAESTTAQAIGDLTAIGKKRFLVIERDNFEGAAAVFKKIYVVDLDEVDEEGFLVKREVADLLNIQDPHGIIGKDPVFRFPFQTIESVIPLGPTLLGVLDDNNYPFSNGRVAGKPDPNEFIVIRLDQPLFREKKHDDDDDDDDWKKDR